MKTNILPSQGVTDFQATVKQCHNPEHAHRCADIEVITAEVYGVPVQIESEIGSGVFNVKFGSASAVHLNGYAARMFIFEQIEELTA